MKTKRIPGRPVKYKGESEHFPLRFRNAKEIKLWEHYKKCADDIGCSYNSLIIEAMAAYEKKWK